MKTTRTAPLLVLAVLSAAAVLAVAAPPAPARAPSAADQGSMDWLLLRFARDREEENKAGGVVDPVVAFRTGEGPLEGDAGWKAMLAIVYAPPPEKPGRKADAATAIVDRFNLENERRAKLEDDRKGPELKALWEIKKQVCRDTCNQKGMLSSNQVVLSCVLKIQKGLLPPEWVTWKETDSLKVRKKAYDDLTTKKLK